MEETMKIPKPVLTVYIVLSIIVFITHVVIFPVGLVLLGSFGRNFGLLIIWVYATAILMIMKSISLIRTKNVEPMVYGIILLVMGIAVVLFGYHIIDTASLYFWSRF
jgi:hypothetical protein